MTDNARSIPDNPIQSPSSHFSDQFDFKNAALNALKIAYVALWGVGTFILSSSVLFVFFIMSYILTAGSFTMLEANIIALAQITVNSSLVVTSMAVALQSYIVFSNQYFIADNMKTLFRSHGFSKRSDHKSG